MDLHRQHGEYGVVISPVLDSDGNWVVGHLTIAARVDSRHVSRHGITASKLRSLPLAEWLAELPVKAPDEQPSDPYGEWRADPRSARNSRLTDKALADTAAIYRTAMDAGHDPTNKVAEVLRKPRNTAGRWVKEARRRGYLEPFTRPTDGGAD